IAYYPQTNGLIKRFNKTLCFTLLKLVGDYKNIWDTLLSSFVRPTTTTRRRNLRKLLEQSLDLHIKKITDQLDQQRLQAQNNIKE
ncbi:23924_t:CDS:2, partial [Gigaspora margarita]